METAVGADPLGRPGLLEAWKTLWEADPSASVFHHPAYMRAWLPEFGGERCPVTVEVARDGALAGLATLSVDPDGVLRFLGDNDVTDYFGPLALPGARDEVAAAAVDAALSVPDWSRAELLGLDAGTGWHEAIARAAAAAGLRVAERQQNVCPRVALGGTYDDYLEGLPGKQRHEIKRKARRLEREAGPYTIRLADPGNLHADLETFFELHRTSSGPKGHFLHWGMAGFFILLARAFAERGWLRLSFLEVKGEALAAVLSFAVRGAWNVYNSGYDHRYRELGPGMVLMAETIRLAAEEGSHTFDLLRGDEPYKYRLGAVDAPLIALDIVRG